MVRQLLYEDRMSRTPANTKANDLPPTPDRCPKCGGTKLMLHGALRRPVQQPLLNGRAIGSRKIASRKDIVWDKISCLTCGRHCEKTDARILELRAEVEELQLRLALVTGSLVSENRLPC